MSSRADAFLTLCCFISNNDLAYVKLSHDGQTVNLVTALLHIQSYTPRHRVAIAGLWKNTLIEL